MLKFSSQLELKSGFLVFPLKPTIIEELEQKIETMNTEVSAPEFYSQKEVEIKRMLQQLEDNNLQLAAAYLKWERLLERDTVK